MNKHTALLSCLLWLERQNSSLPRQVLHVLCTRKSVYKGHHSYQQNVLSLDTVVLLLVATLKSGHPLQCGLESLPLLVRYQCTLYLLALSTKSTSLMWPQFHGKWWYLNKEGPLYTSILRPPMIIRLFDLVPKGNFLC